uniref:Uncharacterized protein n=1 Tax=Marseillevirus LCMAC101 TaxID=2506602 RepID=A0A481YSS8_9VIRU|nr:MAG: hypothetical protein LCMAC101_05920 [Marseillevirus LCMAC101]
MKNGQILFIVIVVILIVILLICYNSDDGQKSKYIGTPEWAMERYSFGEGEPIILTFTYDYTGKTYDDSQTSFSLAILSCTGDLVATCPKLNCGVIGTPTPTCDPKNPTGTPLKWTAYFAGTDNIDGTPVGGLTTYSYEVPMSDNYPIGNYISYVMSYVTANENVQSDPVASDQTITISPPTGSPPTYKITGPTSDQYFKFDTASIVFKWELLSDDSKYTDPYTFTLTIKDVTIVTNIVYTSDPLPSTTLTLTVPNIWYPGQFEATITATAILPNIDSLHTESPSVGSDFYIKLPVPTAIAADLS